MTRLPNLFDDAEAPSRGERFDALLQQPDLLIERIVSSDDIEPTPCLQAHDEWVLLLRGEADLSVAGVRHTLKPGDHVFLPRGTPHTVERTAAGTVWLAIRRHPSMGG